MRTRRAIIALLASALGAGCAGSDDSSEPTGTATGRVTDSTATGSTRDPTATGSATGGQPETGEVGLTLSSPAFDAGNSIPARHTADGDDVSPRLVVDGVPDDADSLALALDDPDAGGFVHWLLWNVPADVDAVPENVPRTETVSSLGDARQGTNGFGDIGYRGPAPPADDGAHTYRFTLWAVDRTLDLAPGATRESLTDALDGHRIASTLLTGDYDR